MNKWSKHVEKMLKSQNVDGPVDGLWLGSSVFRMWRLHKFFPGKMYLNRAFGGACVSDILHFYDQLVPNITTPMVVIYAGDNDLADGVSPEGVHQLMTMLLSKIAQDMPLARRIVVPIKPSRMRWSIREAQLDLMEIAKREWDCTLVPGIEAFINGDGTPDPKFLMGDGLHLNDEGYKLMTEIVGPHL